MIASCARSSASAAEAVHRAAILRARSKSTPISEVSKPSLDPLTKDGESSHHQIPTYVAMDCHKNVSAWLHSYRFTASAKKGSHNSTQVRRRSKRRVLMLAPDVTTAQQQITDTFNSNASITAAVHSLENTVLQTLTPTPSWYTTINTALKTSQQQSMSWLLQTSPSIFATATQSYIDYANIFATTQEAMQNIVNQISTTPTAQQQALLTTFVQTLLNTAQKNLTACSSLQTQMTTFRTQMQTNQSTISTAVTAALADEGQIAAQIQATQTQIDSLM